MYEKIKYRTIRTGVWLTTLLISIIPLYTLPTKKTLINVFILVIIPIVILYIYSGYLWGYTTKHKNQKMILKNQIKKPINLDKIKMLLKKPVHINPLDHNQRKPVLVIFYYTLFMSITLYILSQITHQKQVNSIFINFINELDPTNIKILIFTLIYLPIIEEIIFRLAIFSLSKTNTRGLYISILVSTLVHGPLSIYSFFIYLIISTALSLIYYKHGDIRYSISIHFLLNLITLIIYII